MSIVKEALAGTLDFTKLDGDDWMYLLRKHLQFADHCDWSKLNGYNWANLLCAQLQFADHCDWSKLDRHDWTYLLREQPQFADHCTQYVFEHRCGDIKRTIYINIDKPMLIHIGCFEGTEEEAISAINKEYSGQAATDYISKVKSCFAKL